MTLSPAPQIIRQVHNYVMTCMLKALLVSGGNVVGKNMQIQAIFKKSW